MFIALNIIFGIAVLVGMVALIGHAIRAEHRIHGPQGLKNARVRQPRTRGHQAPQRSYRTGPVSASRA